MDTNKIEKTRLKKSKYTLKETDDTKSKKWCFDYFYIDNTGLPKGMPNFEDWGIHPKDEYIIVGDEFAPSTGNPHLQGYVRFVNARSRYTMRNKFPAAANFRIANGTDLQNFRYCSKDKIYYTAGTLKMIPLKHIKLTYTRMPDRLFSDQFLEIMDEIQVNSTHPDISMPFNISGGYNTPQEIMNDDVINRECANFKLPENSLKDFYNEDDEVSSSYETEHDLDT